MRISDWSSDVCSSDLAAAGAGTEFSVVALAGAASAAIFPPGSIPRRRCRHSVVAFFRHAQRITGLGKRTASEARAIRSEEHTSELQSLMRISYAVFCLKQKNTIQKKRQYHKY